ncbi:lysyl-tRNA synthetase [Streptococcus pneumoniae]|nr:lysyl-tRNA synthetase [Streptococcus pneumoniae]
MDRTGDVSNTTYGKATLTWVEEIFEEHDKAKLTWFEEIFKEY